MKVTTFIINDQSYDISVDNAGTFIATVANEVLTAKTLNELRDKVKRAAKQKAVRMEIKFERWDEGRLVTGIATGLHAGNGNLLVKVADGKTEQEWPSSYATDKYLRFQDENTRKRYVELKTAIKDFEREAENIEKKCSFNPLDEVKKNLRKAGQL